VNLLEITPVNAPAGTVEVLVRGELDAYTGQQLQEVLRERAELADNHDVVLEAGDITFLDSGGLRALLDVDRELRSRGGRLTLRRPSDQVRVVLDMTDLSGHFDGNTED
jgi:anti-sigma B factor antagonist